MNESSQATKPCSSSQYRAFPQGPAIYSCLLWKNIVWTYLLASLGKEVPRASPSQLGVKTMLLGPKYLAQGSRDSADQHLEILKQQCQQASGEPWVQACLGLRCSTHMALPPGSSPQQPPQPHCPDMSLPDGRTRAHGKPRWPSLQSLFTGSSLVTLIKS